MSDFIVNDLYRYPARLRKRFGYAGISEEINLWFYKGLFYGFRVVCPRIGINYKFEDIELYLNRYFSNLPMIMLNF